MKISKSKKIQATLAAAVVVLSSFLWQVPSVWAQPPGGVLPFYEAWAFEDHTHNIAAVAGDSAGNAYSASWDGTLRKINSSGAEVWSFTGHSNDVRSVAVESDGSHVYSASFDGTVRKIDSNGDEVWRFSDHEGVVNAVAVDSSGNVYSGGNDGTVRKIDSNGDEVWSATNHSDSVLAVAVDSSGNVYSGSDDNAMRKFNSSGSQVWSFTSHTDSVTGVAVDSSGNVYTSSRDNTVRKINSSGSQVWVYDDYDSDVRDVAVNNSGYVYAVSLDSTLRKITFDGEDVWTFTGHDSSINAVAYAAGNVYSGGNDNIVRAVTDVSRPFDSLNNRKLSMSSSEDSATGVDYTVSFNFPENTNFGSFFAAICTVKVDNPLEDCVTPSGFAFDTADATATIDGTPVNIGSQDFTVDGANGAFITLEFAGVESVSSSDDIVVEVSGITNPDETNSGYFIHLYTFRDVGLTDFDSSGGVAFSTGDVISSTARVVESIQFCVYTDATCGDGGSTVVLDDLDSSVTSLSELYFDISTNATYGVVVTFVGGDLEGDVGSIPAVGGTPVAFSPGTNQFGLRVASATPIDTPGVGMKAPFDTMASNEYLLDAGESTVIAESAGPSHVTKFTIEYAANIAPATPSQEYSTAFEYIATGKF